MPVVVGIVLIRRMHYCHEGHIPLFKFVCCQIAPKRDPLFASNFDPLTVPECHGLEGFGAVMGMALLERLERREGVARPEFQPLQQQILFPVGRGVSCGF